MVEWRPRAAHGSFDSWRTAGATAQHSRQLLASAEKDAIEKRRQSEVTTVTKPDRFHTVAVLQPGWRPERNRRAAAHQQAIDMGAETSTPAAPAAAAAAAAAPAAAGPKVGKSGKKICWCPCINSDAATRD